MKLYSENDILSGQMLPLEGNMLSSGKYLGKPRRRSRYALERLTHVIVHVGQQAKCMLTIRYVVFQELASGCNLSICAVSMRSIVVDLNDRVPVVKQ